MIMCTLVLHVNYESSEYVQEIEYFLENSTKISLLNSLDN